MLHPGCNTNLRLGFGATLNHSEIKIQYSSASWIGNHGNTYFQFLAFPLKIELVAPQFRLELVMGEPA